MDEYLLNHALDQGAKAAHLAIDEGEVNEALAATLGWARITYDRLIEHDIPAISAASLVVSAVHATLTHKILEPIEHETEPD